jgi:hypothetical protein
MGGMTWFLGVAGYYDSTGNRLVETQGVFAGPGVPLDAIRDGTSQTLLVGERPPPDNLQAGWWYPVYIGDSTGNQGPNNRISFDELVPFYAQNECIHPSKGFGPGRLDNPCDRYHFWSLHRGGGNWLFADSSIRIQTHNQVDTLRFMSSYAGNVTITE